MSTKNDKYYREGVIALILGAAFSIGFICAAVFFVCLTIAICQELFF